MVGGRVDGGEGERRGRGGGGGKEGGEWWEGGWMEGKEGGIGNKRKWEMGGIEGEKYNNDFLTCSTDLSFLPSVWGDFSRI